MMEENQEQRLENIIVKIRHGDTMYGLNGRRVQEIIKLPVLTAVPRQPYYLRGIFHFKGNILPVISMSRICGEDRSNQENLCIIFQVGARSYALSVEDVSEMEYDTGDELEMKGRDERDRVLVIRKVIDGVQPVFVLDMGKTMDKLEEG